MKYALHQAFDYDGNPAWKVFKIMSEFIDGFQFLSGLKREVTFLGSARATPTSWHYQEALKLGIMLGKAGFTIVTGGGPGIMEAGNKGAYKAKAPSVGINIMLPHEQRTNKYVTKSTAFHYFFTRKVMLAASAQAFVFFPGGFGTLDEFFEMLTLVQTKKMEKVPLILVGKHYWAPLLHWIDTTIEAEYGAISPGDTKLYTLVNSAQEAFDIIRATPERQYF